MFDLGTLKQMGKELAVSLYLENNCTKVIFGSGYIPLSYRNVCHPSLIVMLLLPLVIGREISVVLFSD